MKRITKYFGGIYMRYWYIACGLILICAFISVYNDSSVKEFELTEYDAAGAIVKEEKVDKLFVARELASLPVTKKFIPLKMF